MTQAFENVQEKFLAALGITPQALNDYGLYEAILQHPDTQDMIEAALMEKLSMIGYKVPKNMEFDYSSPEQLYPSLLLTSLKSANSVGEVSGLRELHAQLCAQLDARKGEEIDPSEFLTAVLDDNVSGFHAGLCTVVDDKSTGEGRRIEDVTAAIGDFRMAQKAILAAEIFAKSQKLRRHSSKQTDIESAIEEAEQAGDIPALEQLALPHINAGTDNHIKAPPGFQRHAAGFLADLGLPKSALAGMPEQEAFWNALTHHPSLAPMVESLAVYYLAALGYETDGLQLDYRNPKEAEALHKLFQGAFSCLEQPDQPEQYLKEFIDHMRVLDRDNHAWLAECTLHKMEDGAVQLMDTLLGALDLDRKATRSLFEHEGFIPLSSPHMIPEIAKQQVAENYGIGSAAAMVRAADTLARLHDLRKDPLDHVQHVVTAAQRLGVVAAPQQTRYVH